MLLEKGYRIYGISRTTPAPCASHPAFVHCRCDLENTASIKETAAFVRQSTGRRLHLLLNCAGAGRFAPHEEIPVDWIHRMVALNLEAPLVLTSLFLRDLKRTRGFVINISSVTATEPAPRGCAYAATKAGLAHFSRSLFAEVRRSGVKAVCIMPDITRTPFFDRLDFGPADDPETRLEPSCVAGAVKTVLEQREGTVLTEMVLRPARFRIEKKPRLTGQEAGGEPSR